MKLFEAALADMRNQGAEIVESIKVAEIDDIPAAALGNCNRFKHDLKAYLAHLGPDAPMKSLDDILASQKFHPSVEKRRLPKKLDLRLRGFRTDVWSNSRRNCSFFTTPPDWTSVPQP